LKASITIILALYDPKCLIKFLDSCSQWGIDVRGIPVGSKEIDGIAIFDDEFEKHMAAHVVIKGPAIKTRCIDPLCALLKASAYYVIGRKEVSSVVIGIDVGENYGFAFLADYQPIAARSFRSHTEFISVVISVLNCFREARRVVKIGHTRAVAKKVDKVVEDLLRVLDPDVEVAIVPDVGPPRIIAMPPPLGHLDEDSAAALNIALS